MSRTSRLVVGAIVVIAAAGGGYYYYTTTKAKSQQQAQQRPAPPPPEVGIVEVKRSDVPLTLAYAGRVAGFRNVEVRAQVSGIVLKREYTEGAKVKQGDVLFRIDPRPYQATLDRANAQLSQAKATALQADENFGRIDELSRRQVATAKQLEDARAARDQSRAAIQSVDADIATAKLNLEFTTVTAPVTGPTSLSSPPEGSLAQSQQTVLTTITQLDPAYVNFSSSETEFVELRDMNRARERPLTEKDITVSLQFGDGTAFPVKGKLNESASTVDQRTGTLQIRSIFPNPDGALLPGQFVRVIVTGISLQNAFVIPQQSISQGPQGPFVYVVNDKSGVDIRPLKLDREVKGGWIVKDGLKDGEKIVVDGVMRVRPGAPVRPVPFDPKADSAAAQAKAAGPAPAGPPAASPPAGAK